MYFLKGDIQLLSSSRIATGKNTNIAEVSAQQQSTWGCIFETHKFPIEAPKTSQPYGATSTFPLCLTPFRLFAAVTSARISCTLRPEALAAA